jgi:hypothetical protein
MRLMRASVGISYAVQAVFTVVAGAVVAIVWRRGVSLPARSAVLASATLVAVPLSLIYDMMLGAIAACWLLRVTDRKAMPAWEKTTLTLVYVALLDSRTLGEGLSLPVNTICALILFGLATRRAARELGLSLPLRRSLGAAPTR